MKILATILFAAGVFAFAITLGLRDHGPDRVFGSFLSRWGTTLRIVGAVCLVLAVLVAIVGSN